MMIHLITRSRSSGIVKVQIDLSSCALKTELKGAIWIDTFKLTSKKNSACLKIKVDNLYVDKPFFYYFFYVVKTFILVTKFNAINTKIPSTSELVTECVLVTNPLVLGILILILIYYNLGKQGLEKKI